MPHTNHARDRFLLPLVALLLVGSVSWAADSPMTLSVRPTVSDVQLDGGHQTAPQCFAVLGLDDSSDTLRAPRRPAPAEPAAIRRGC